MIKVAIIGPGKIGLTGFNKNKIDSYFKALNNKEFNVCLFDENDEFYKTPKGKFDVIVVSAPTIYHKDIYKLAVLKNPKLIILEKPAGNSFEDLMEMKSMGFYNTIVNYQRKLSGDFDFLKNDLKSLNYVLCIFDGSLVNIGSHFIDLLIYLLGPPTGWCKTLNLITLFYKDFKCDILNIKHQQYQDRSLHFYKDHDKIELIRGGEEIIYLKSKDIYTPIKPYKKIKIDLWNTCKHIPDLIKNNLNNTSEPVGGLTQIIPVSQIIYEKI